jgi:hypothetical protein
MTQGRLLAVAYAMVKISTPGGASLMTASGTEQQKTTTLSQSRSGIAEVWPPSNPSWGNGLSPTSQWTELTLVPIY